MKRSVSGASGSPSPWPSDGGALEGGLGLAVRHGEALDVAAREKLAEAQGLVDILGLDLQADIGGSPEAELLAGDGQGSGQDRLVDHQRRGRGYRDPVDHALRRRP